MSTQVSASNLDTVPNARQIGAPLVPALPSVNVDDIEECRLISTPSQEWESDRIGSHLPTPPPDESSSTPAFTPSATFHADLLFDLSRPDLKILSTDNHLFHIHRHVLLRASENGFAELLTDDALVHIPETAVIMNIMFAAIYGVKLADNYPLDTLIHVIDRFPHYGLQPKAHVRPAASLYEAVHDQTPLAPFQVYALASRYDLEELAIAASPHLLDFNLRSITDEMVDIIRPTYLLRLFRLYFTRRDALKGLLSGRLEAHIPTASCNHSTYDSLCQAWVLAGACLLWDADVNVSVATVQSTLFSLHNGVECKSCRQILTKRTKSIVVQWSETKSTI